MELNWQKNDGLAGFWLSLPQGAVMILLLIVGMILSIVGQLRGNERGQSLVRFATLYLFLLIFLWLSYGSLNRLGWYYALNHREAVVPAIRSFEVDHGYPPPDLEALIPNYLSEHPESIGANISAYYRYQVGHTVRERYGNEWSLEIHFSYGWFEDSSYLYLPAEKYYPSTRFRYQVGKWMYLGG